MADFSDGFVLSLLLGGEKDPETFRTLTGRIYISSDESGEYMYMAESVIYTKEIKIKKTQTDKEGNRTVTETSETFSKEIITKVSKINENGETVDIMKTDYSGGTISGYTDENGGELTVGY